VRNFACGISSLSAARMTLPDCFSCAAKISSGAINGTVGQSHQRLIVAQFGEKNVEGHRFGPFQREFLQGRGIDIARPIKSVVEAQMRVVFTS
jgi:hypothetical protein